MIQNIQKSKILFFLLMFLLIACQGKNKKSAPVEQDALFYVGTYTNGESKGIYQYALKENGKLEKHGLQASSENPSFITLSKDKQYLLAVNETDVNGHGSVESFRVHKDSLELVSKSHSGGAHPCFIDIDANGYVLTANYSGGNVGLLKMDHKGVLSDLLDIRQHEGSGNTERQKGPHAHAARFYNNDYVLAADLGTNALWVYQLDRSMNKLIPAEPPFLKLESGAGPRHMAFHHGGKWIYVVNELNSTVSLINRRQHDEFILEASFSTLPEAYDEPSFCGDIHISGDGKFLYVSNRGHNSIAIFEIDQETGMLTSVGYRSTNGDWPRNFTLSPDENFLLVANQKSNTIVAFERNKTSGLLRLVDEIDAPTPVCLLF